MRISRFLAPAVLALTIAACSKDKDPTAPTDAQIAKLAGANLQTLSTKITNPQVKTATKLAGGMLIDGAPFTEVTLTTSASASRHRDALLNARVSADIGNATETWAATALQVVVTNSSTAAANGTYNLIVAWKGETDVVFVGAPNGTASTAIGTTAGDAFGGLFTAPNSSWQATTGSAAISNSSVGSACASFISATGITCKDAAFTGGFGITASVPFSAAGNTATGSRTAALTSRSFSGIQVTVNCSVYAC